jgi:hypothetical protein
MWLFLLLVAKITGFQVTSGAHAAWLWETWQGVVEKYTRMFGYIHVSMQSYWMELPGLSFCLP